MTPPGDGAGEIFSDTGYAKINLALHVRSRREDGKHAIETLFAFAADGDRLTVAPSAALSLSIIGPFAGGLSCGPDNLVLRAAERLRQACGVRDGAHFTLDKRLPVASGIGGGSADAAAALRLAARLWRQDIAAARLLELAGALGADVPACVASTASLGTGLGNQLEQVDSAGIAGLPVLLVNPLKPCPTGPVFAGWDGIDGGALVAAEWQSARNDLEAPARALVPEIGAVLAALTAQPGVRLARMSGSGATCFALFDDFSARDVTEQALRLAHPDWWTLATHLRG